MLSHLGETWERFVEVEVGFSVNLGQLIELGFVGFHLLDKVEEVFGLLKLLQVFAVDDVA